MKIEIQVPTNLNEVTLGQYQKFVKLSETNPQGNFLNAKMIEIFCGISLKDTYKLKVSSVDAITDILNNLFTENPKHIERFNFNGVEYGFIPDLDEMSLGEYIDLDNNISSWETMHNAMNVLYRPIKSETKGKYNLKEYNTLTPEAMQRMPLAPVLGCLVFSYNLGNELARHTIASLPQVEGERLQKKLNLDKNGVGISHFTNSLEEMLQGLTISLN